MRCIRNGQSLLVITLGISFIAWGQGGGQTGRGAATQQAGAAGRGAAWRRRCRQRRQRFLQLRYGGGLRDWRFPMPRPRRLTRRSPSMGKRSPTPRGSATCRCATRRPDNRKLICFSPATAKDGVSDATARPLLFFLGGAPGCGSHLAGIWRVGSEADEVDERRHRRAAALWMGGQSPHPARPGGSGFRESGGHGIQPTRPAQPGPELLEYGRRHRFTRRVRAQLHQYLQSPEFTALSGGRGFWHGAGGGFGRLPQRTPDPGSMAWCCCR